LHTLNDKCEKVHNIGIHGNCFRHSMTVDLG